MRTKTIYYQDPYKIATEASVLNMEGGTGLFSNILLDQTVFFPEGGGQPGDRGEIIGQNGSAKIEYTRIINGEIIHQGKVIGDLKNGEKVKALIDWNWRYKYMKIHSAGHLIHDVFMEMVDGLTPLRGSHGIKAFLEYSGSVDVNIKEALAEKVNEAVIQGLPIVTKEVSYDELTKECRFLPRNLPKNKPLRMIKIADYSVMPDGGVHVKNTKEIGKIVINELLSGNGIVTIKYRVFGIE